MRPNTNATSAMGDGLQKMDTSESTERRHFEMHSSYTACFSKTQTAAVLVKLLPSQSSTNDDVKR